MTYRYQLYKCPICGTVTEIVHDGVSAMICCGKTMEVLDDREPVGTKESHMPVVEATEKGCKVSVGSKLHGMDQLNDTAFQECLGILCFIIFGVFRKVAHCNGFLQAERAPRYGRRSPDRMG